VAAQHRGAYVVYAAHGERPAGVAGRLRHAAVAAADLPAVGDWVAVEDAPNAAAATVHAVLERSTAFSRKAAGEEVAEQVVAANVDVVFVVASLADDVNPRLLERYLTLVWESGARPVILLTKADLQPDPESIVRDLDDLGDVTVHAISARTGHGLDAVRGYLAPGVTGALLGPSGVGKSTLVNALVADDLLATGEVARDGSGRHTTTRRELILVPGGGLVVDNPGMRELHLWLADDGLEDAFEDVVELAARCRFSDCRHEGEPGCAVAAAIAAGTLDPERLASYHQLERELSELEERLERRERSRARRKRPDAGPS
jgi:ribosome biogenesis GTPase